MLWRSVLRMQVKVSEKYRPKYTREHFFAEAKPHIKIRVVH